MRAMARMGLAHGDLSAFNILAADDRLVLIDLLQAVDLIANPQGMEFLARDCENVATWFATRGFAVDADELLADLVAYVLVEVLDQRLRQMPAARRVRVAVREPSRDKPSALGEPSSAW